MKSGDGLRCLAAAWYGSSRRLTVSLVRGTFLGLLVLTLVTAAFAQKASTVFGETVKGVVVTANEATREITLAYRDKDKTQTFVAVLESGYKQKLRDGTYRELAISELKPGLRVRVFYKQKTELVNGRKVKVPIVNRIDFLGRDEYTKLREILALPPSFPVTRVDSVKLPAGDPLKIYLSIPAPQIEKRFLRWVKQWNAYDAQKYGRVEVVSDQAQADISAVFFWGSDEAFDLVSFPMGIQGYDLHSMSPGTAQLVTKDDEGLKVLWLKFVLETPDSAEEFQGLMEKELEKRLKTRAKK